jgi:hypothetical protein
MGERACSFLSALSTDGRKGWPATVDSIERVADETCGKGVARCRHPLSQVLVFRASVQLVSGLARPS